MRSGFAGSLLDTGADQSSLNIDFLNKNKFNITPFTHNAPVITCIDGLEGKRVGEVKNVILKYGGKTVTHTFEALLLSENTTMTIGMDLMPKLGISIHRLATS